MAFDDSCRYEIILYRILMKTIVNMWVSKKAAEAQYRLLKSNLYT